MVMRTTSALSQRSPKNLLTPSMPPRVTGRDLNPTVTLTILLRMALLVAFAVLAGAGTALTPCVLPVLPALLSASATGGRRRPLGVILGLTITT